MSNELSQRAVYASLRRMTDDRSVIKSAYDHWLSELSHKELDVIEVVSTLVEFLGLSSQEKKTLMISLHSSSNKLVDELAPVPGIITGAGNDDIEAITTTGGSPTADRVSPAQAITQRYLQLFSQHIRKVSQADFTEFRRAMIKEGLSGVDEPTAAAINSWASDGMANIKLPGGISEDACKSVTHGFYMLASEFIGPNECDDIATKVINSCLDMEEATRFNPRDLA